MTVLLHQLMQQAAERQPDAIAVIDKENQTSYRQLAESAAQLANLLTQLAVPRHARVGLLLHKSIYAYEGIYGLLEAGLAYVPLDPRAPPERLAYICRDCEIDTLLVTSTQLHKLPAILGHYPALKQIICLDQESPAGEMDCAQYGRSDFSGLAKQFHPSFQIVDHDLAYILYTSGSTGMPKGVMISHHVAMSFVRWSCNHAGVTQADKVSGHAPLHFDLSIFDIFATAMAGATLVPVPDGTSTFPSRLLDWMVYNQINVWYSVPSILSMMAQSANFEQADFSHLRLIIFAGEVFPVPYLKLWRQRLPELTMMNWFGPTETNVITSYTVTETAQQLDTPVPIGQATDNADLFCLDENGAAVTKIGESGLLYARGACVALGYWGDESKTRARFVANQQQPWLDDRVFNTGDIVTLDTDGNYRYQGRNDHMVKSRGYRIELGEVEAAFYQQQVVAEAVVIALPDDLIGHKLIACIVTHKSKAKQLDQDQAEQEINQVAQGISKFLPHYMVPGGSKIMAALPKTSNGKVDRQKLTQQLQQEYSEQNK